MLLDLRNARILTEEKGRMARYSRLLFKKRESGTMKPMV